MGLLKRINENLILKASVWVAAITLLTKLVGYGEKVAIAYFWGTGYQADTYNAIYTIIIGIAIFFREIFEPGFLNILIQIREREGRQGSGQVFVSMVWVIGAVALLLCATIGFFPQATAKLFLSGFKGEKLELAICFFRFGSIALFFLTLASVTNTYLLSVKKFVTIALSDFAFKTIILLCIIGLYQSNGVYAAIWGLVFSTFGKFLIQVLKTKSNLQYHDHRPRKDFIAMIMMVSWPLLVGNLFSQLSNIVDNTFASHLNEGSISALTYARKLIDLPVVLIPYTLSMVVFPFFTQLSVEKDLVKLNKLLQDSLRYILILFLPVMVYIALFSTPIIQLVFERGTFDSESTLLTAKAFSVYNMGIVAFALETILVIFMLAQNRIKRAVVLGIISVLLDIAFIALLIGRLDYLAIAWALVLSKWVKVILLFYCIRKNLPSRKIVPFLLKLILATFVSTIPCVVVALLLSESGNSPIALLGILSALAVGSLAIYYLVLRKLGLIDPLFGKESTN